MIYFCYLSILVAWASLITGGDGAGIITMQISPAEKVLPGTHVTVSCSLDRSKSSYPLLWLRRQGSMTSKLASGDVLDKYVDNGRYELDMVAQGSQENFTLIINSVQFDDTSTIECTLDDGQESKRAAVIVCDHLNSKSCNCLHTEGFNYPGCFDEPDTVKEAKDRYRSSIVGLAVCFVIVVVYAVLVTILLSRDCVTKLYARRQKLLEKVRKPKANGRVPQRSAYQHADNLEIDPSEAPNWGPPAGQSGGGSGPRNYAPVGSPHTHMNAAFEDDANIQDDIRPPAIHPDARQGMGHGYMDPAPNYADYSRTPGHGPDGSARTTAVVEHHSPPPSAPPLGPEPQLYPPLNQTNAHMAVKPKQSGYPTQVSTYPQPIPSSYPRTPTGHAQGPGGHPSSSGGGYPPRAPPSPNTNANGYLPNDVTVRHPTTPTSRSALSPPSTPYDAQKSPGGISTVSGNMTPRSVYSEQAYSNQSGANVPDRGAYTDVPREKQNGGGAAYRAGGGNKSHQHEPRKLEFTGSSSNNNNEAYINKSDTVV